MSATRTELEALIRDVDGDAQLHLLDGFAALPEPEQAALAAQIRRIFRRGTVGPTRVFSESLAMSSEPPQGITAPTAEDIINISPHSTEWSAVWQAGLDFIGRGKAALIVLAGGSGSRLGVAFPKGMLVCPDLAHPKSLFQLQCEKVLYAQRLSGAVSPIPLCFMTSPATDGLTREFLATHGYFGLAAEQVHFFCQSTMPCFTEGGRIVLASPSVIAEAPGGNAGIYAALAESGLLARLEKLGVEACQVVTVDNMLARLLDPAMFGIAAINDVDVAVKTVAKAHDHEAVGVFARRSYPAGATNVDAAVAAAPSGRWGVVEYTEIGAALAEAKSSSGDRVFNCANIGIHLFSTRFLRAAADAMTRFSYYHIARKPIPTQLPELHGAAAGAPSVKGVKLEAFIFDLFLLVDPSTADPRKRSFAVIMTDRANEFSAIKNADDPTVSVKGAEVKKDSPQSAVADLHALHASWLRDALVRIHATEASKVAIRVGVEISPLVACFGALDVEAALRSNADCQAAVFDAVSRASQGDAGQTIVLDRRSNGSISVAVLGHRESNAL